MLRTWLVLGVMALGFCLQAEELKPDEEVYFFPTYALLSHDGKTAAARIHGWIYEPEENAAVRRTFMSWLEGQWSPEEAASHPYFEKRMHYFLADNERGKIASIRIAGKEHRLKPSGADGHVREEMTVSEGEWAGAKELFFECRGRRWPMPVLSAKGLSVISDIDDTIKVTSVTVRDNLVANTFYREFRAVDGMAKRYAAWAKKGAAFHYVSASPWPLAPALVEFMEAAGFPRGSFHLREFRFKDKSFPAFFKDSVGHKAKSIEQLLQEFPGRRFILVGDSAEKDPEIYGNIAQAFEGRIERIYIRPCEGVDNSDERFKKAFDDLPDSLWSLLP